MSADKSDSNNTATAGSNLCLKLFNIYTLQDVQMQELATRTNAVLPYPRLSSPCLVETPFSSQKALN